MSAVTLAMLIAIKVTDNALNDVGKYPLTTKERQIMLDAGFTFADIDNINEEIKAINFNE